jgi:tetratricopeptide (TPR) repeat protein
VPARQRLPGVAALRRGALRVARPVCALGLALGPLLGLAVGLCAAPAAAQAAAAADAAYAEGRLSDARDAYARALAAGALEADALVHVHLRLGALAALGQEEARAARHFAAALALAPDAAAPDGLDAEAREAFAAIRHARQGARLRAVVEGADAPAPVRIDVREAPPGLVHALEVRGRGGFSRRLAFRGDAVALDAPAAARPLTVRVLDAHGNVLARAGAPAPDAPPPSEAPPEPPPEPEADAGLVESPWFWVVVGAVVLGVGLAVGLGASGERYVLDAPVVR